MFCCFRHLESALDGTRFPAHSLATLHEGRPLWVRYDLHAARESGVIFNTGAAQKNVEAIRADLPRLGCQTEPDWSRFA